MSIGPLLAIITVVLLLVDAFAVRTASKRSAQKRVPAFAHPGGGPGAPEGPDKPPPPTKDNIVRIVLTFLLAASALYVILSGHYQDATSKWAFGTIGSLVGYWFGKS